VRVLWAANAPRWLIRLGRWLFAGYVPVRLTHEFTRLPRSGDTVYGFVAGLYPTECPTLPGQDHGTGTAGLDSQAR
jgi:hypothetical protein